MTHALKNVPVQEAAAPPGVSQVGGLWMYDEFANGSGVQSLGLEDTVPVTPTTDERNSILDLFRR